MDSKVHVASEQEKYIQDADLGFVTNRLIQQVGWSKSQAVEGLKQYRRFLLLRSKYPYKELPPSIDIDEVWHAHILHTEQYRDFCKTAFPHFKNAFYDHVPEVPSVFTESIIRNAYLETRKLYRQHFDEDIYEIVNPATQWLRIVFIRLKNFVTRIYYFSRRQGNTEHAF